MVENSIFPYSLFNFDQILIMYKWNELVIYFLSSLLATFKHHLRLYSSQVGFPNPGYFIQTQVPYWVVIKQKPGFGFMHIIGHTWCCGSCQ